MGLFSFLFGERKNDHALYLECMAEIEQNRVMLDIQRMEREAERIRLRSEMERIRFFSERCMEAISRHRNKIPHEDYAFYFLYEGFSAFLPISIKPFIEKWET
jgi:hypothetical protein